MRNCIGPWVAHCNIYLYCLYRAGAGVMLYFQPMADVWLTLAVSLVVSTCYHDCCQGSDLVRTDLPSDAHHHQQRLSNSGRREVDE